MSPRFGFGSMADEELPEALGDPNQLLRRHLMSCSKTPWSMQPVFPHLLLFLSKDPCKMTRVQSGM